MAENFSAAVVVEHIVAEAPRFLRDPVPAL
jgi:hypothetical protein